MLQATPRNYQRKAVNIILNRFNGRALLADDMGLGKSLMSIMIIDRLEGNKVLIACPSSLKYNWLAEFNKFLPGEVPYICQGRTVPRRNKIKNRVIICNYEILQYWKSFIIKNDVNICIYDESHYLKNKGANRTKAATLISKNCQYRIALTGTPIENNPAELFSQLKIIDPSLFRSYILFIKRYNGARIGAFGKWELNRATNTKELHKALTEKCMVRRRKQDVLTELPPTIRQVIPLEIDNREEYDAAEEDIIKWVRKKTDLDIDKAKKAKAMIKLDKLKYIAAKGKLKAFSTWVNEESKNQKLVVFCYHKDVIASLSKTLNGNVLVDSSKSSKDRQALVNRFQNDDKARVFLTTIRVGGTGLTLTASSTTTFIQLDWNAAKQDQAEARVSRIGQKADTIMALYFIAKDTVEEKIMKLIDDRRKSSLAIIDGEEVKESELLTELLKELTT